jgi:hypothetical protein
MRLIFVVLDILSCGAVAQVSNLLCRGLLAGRVLRTYGACGLEIRDTADLKSALQLLGHVDRITTVRSNQITSL